MSDEAPNLELHEDIFDVALREAVRRGRITREKDSEGRDVYRPAPVN